MDKNEKPLRITEEAARDMWAAACGIAKQDVEFSAEGKNDRPRLQAGNDDLGHLGGGE